MLGFLSRGGIAYLDDLTIKTDRDNNGSYETTEHIEDFQANGSYYEDELDHDAAGNLTFDGHLKYTYDAFNRLTQAQKAYRDNSGGGSTLQTGSTIATYEYDGQHRRISREITNSGQFDAVYHYYCAGASIIEEHVGTNATVIKQHVWGLTYIDELIETTVDATAYYAVLDSKYCVLALLDTSGGIKERYEYTPQGERQVFISAGANDPKAQTPMTQAPRAGTAKAYALCDIGFQGLMHDEVTGNIYQRAREYSPRLARFHQRDPLGYPDGPNTYAPYHVLYGGVDPLGLESVTHWRGEVRERIENHIEQEISPFNFDPELGYDEFTNQRYARSWYLYYALVYQEDPERFLWAGMASQVGYRAVLPTLSVLDTEFQNCETELNNLSWINAGERLMLVVALRHLHSATATTLTIGHAIFSDLAWVHEAYIQQGLEELREQLRKGKITQEVYDAFVLIDTGLGNSINRGTIQLAVYEQVEIVQQFWDRLWFYEKHFATGMASSPILGAKDFSEYDPDGSIARENDRVSWLLNDLILVWIKKSQEQRDRECQTAIDNLSDAFEDD